jgi:L-seryl-tRNA(Ser) seleniumtransferase
MQIPPLKGFVPSDAIKQLSQWVNQPMWTSALKEAAQKLGMKEIPPLANVQEMLRQAGRWIDAAVEPWSTASTAEWKPGINATGELFHTRWTSPRLPAACASVAGMLHTSFTEGHGIEASLHKQLLGGTGAADAVVMPNVALALLVVAKALKESGRIDQVVLPRVACIRLPTSGTQSGVHVRTLLDATGTSVEEIGSSGDCTAEDYRRAIHRDRQLLLLASPCAGDDTREAGIQSARDVSSVVCEVALDGSLHDIPSLGNRGLAMTRRWDGGPDLFIVPGQYLLSGPECGIVLGKKELMIPIRRMAEELGFVCDRVTSGLLLEVLRRSETHEGWLQTPSAAAIATSVENLENRARRIAIQADGAEWLDRLDVQRQACKIGSGNWQGVKLESSVIRVFPAGMSSSRLADELTQHQPPIWCNVLSDHVEIVMRSVEPAEDAMLVHALVQLRSKTASTTEASVVDLSHSDPSTKPQS